MINEPDKDMSALERHLNKLSANEGQLRFNAEKCDVMSATHSRDRSKPSYSVGVQLKSAEGVKDLGVTINYDLSWGKHVYYTKTKRTKC